MQAEIGDHVLVRSTHVGQPDRDGEIVEVHGQDGGPPFVVRWSNDGHQGLFFPGADCQIQHGKA